MKKTTETFEDQIEYSVADITYDVVVTEEYKASTIQNKLPLLPLSLYQQITSWLTDVTETHDTEGVCSLTVVDNEWKVIVWHQDAPCSLHVDFDESLDLLLLLHRNGPVLLIYLAKLETRSTQVIHFHSP